ncbi:MAG: serine hydrolase [Bacteroidota bacterium]|nr:serine hydrolase [Bacteroidota bacterium]
MNNYLSEVESRTFKKVIILFLLFALGYSTFSEAEGKTLKKNKKPQKTYSGKIHSKGNISSKNQKDKQLLISSLLKKNYPIFKECLDNPDKYNVQIIYTQIIRDKNNKPSFKEYTYGLNPNKYFYPASLVKLPTICVAFEKLNKLKKMGINRNTHIGIGADYSCQTNMNCEKSNPDSFPTIGNFIKRMLLVSDNPSYNRLYEFVGQKELNRRMKEIGCSHSYIVQRFSNCSFEENKHTNPFCFLKKDGDTICKVPGAYNDEVLKNPFGKIKLGKAYYSPSNILVNEPMDFSCSNALSLADINHVLKAIIFPESFPENKRFRLSKADYAFLYKYLSMYPRESEYQEYSNYSVYNDAYKKYLMFGAEKSHLDSTNIRIFNIVGIAYGFMSDCAYIVDFKNKIEFMLSAVIYVNSDEILNDNKYEYSEIGFPFMKNLGKIIYDFEKRRKRIYHPNLKNFRQINYLKY